MVDLIHEKVTEQVLAAAFEVSNNLGAGFLEKVYENALKFKRIVLQRKLKHFTVK